MLGIRFVSLEELASKKRKEQFKEELDYFLPTLLIIILGGLGIGIEYSWGAAAIYILSMVTGFALGFEAGKKSNMK